MSDAMEHLTHTRLDILGKPIYTLAGLDWSCTTYNQVHTLTHHRHEGPAAGDWMDVHLRDTGITWTWHRQIDKQVFVDHHGSADTLEEAAAQAAVFTPSILRQNYLGNQVDWYTLSDGKRWKASLAGHAAEIQVSPWMGNPAQAFHWRRECPPVEAVLAMAGSRELIGYAPTLLEAMIAALDAPDRFLVACGALVATLTTAAPVPA